MIKKAFADTNLFLRFFQSDQKSHAQAVQKLFKQVINGDLELYVNDLVLAEVIWTLSGPRYAQNRTYIRSVISTILSMDGIVIESKSIFTQALNQYVVEQIKFLKAYNQAWVHEHWHKKANYRYASDNILLPILSDQYAEERTKAFKRIKSEHLKFVTNPLVLTEVEWKLNKKPKPPKSFIQKQLLAILNTPEIEVWQESIIVKALDIYVRHNIDFPDAFHAAWMQEHELDTVYTFNKKHFDKVEGIKVIVP